MDQYTSRSIDIWKAYLKESLKGYNSGYQKFYDDCLNQYYEQTYGGRGAGGNGTGSGGTGTMTYTFGWWEKINRPLDQSELYYDPKTGSHLIGDVYSILKYHTSSVTLTDYPSGQGGGYRYGSPESNALWAVSAAGAVLNKYFGTLGKVAIFKGTEDYMRKLLKNIPANQIQYLNPQVFKYAKWAQYVGLTGDIANMIFIGSNITKDGLTGRNRLDAFFGVIGFIPIYGDALAFMYMVTPGMDRMLKEDPGFFIRNNQTVVDFRCFIGGSKVTMADGTFKNIEAVQIGDSVLTYNFEYKVLEINPVLYVDAPIHDKLVKVFFSNMKEIVSTEDHPYYVKGKGWCSFNPQQTQKNYNIQAEQLEVSDYCLTIKKNKVKKVKILQIEAFEKSVTTYNLTNIRNSNNYFVNSILVNTESKTKH